MLQEYINIAINKINRFWIFFLFIVFLFSCNNNQTKPFEYDSLENIAVGENYTPKVRKLLWKDGKKAAYTLTFDDARNSHYQLAWPEMEKKGIKGTFFINTSPDLNWIPWICLSRFGNEIGSHTVNHVDLTTLNSDAIKFELEESFKAIWQKTGQVPLSFANPFGKTDSLVDEKIKQYYLASRNQFGINPSNLADDEFYHLRAIGVYPSISQSYLREKIIETIKKNGYLIVSFHSLTKDNMSLDATYLPLTFFQNHLEDLSEFSKELWIAPQKDVIKYMKVRQNSELDFDISRDQIKLLLISNLDNRVFNISITIEILIPQNWRNRKIVAFSKILKPFVVTTNVDSVLYSDISINEELFLRAF